MKANDKRAVIAGSIGLTFGSAAVWMTSGSFTAAIATMLIGSVLGGIGILITRSATSRKE